MELSDLVPAVNAVLFERKDDGRFVIASGVPRWCRMIRPDVRWDDALLVEDVFPFLGVFLPDAERAWKSKSPHPVQSDLWAESQHENGQDLYLMAIAARVKETSALLIVRSDVLFQRRQGVLQRARELQMTHTALMNEIEQKDILIHAIVHDLAAPLHSIIGILSLLEERGHTEPEAGWIHIGMQAAKRQRELISEILDIFTAENGVLGQRPTTAVALGDVLERVAAEREPIARSRNLKLQIDTNARLIPRVVADETRLLRVLTNLVDNAFRYSPPGASVRVTIQPQEDTVTVAVEDEGPGVKPDVLPRLFEKLARGRDSMSGTGLGLFFCRISVENWGGGIGYEEREGGGARFWIRLQLAPRTHAEERREANGERIDARR
jgi:signal transduction histidine kinase